MAKTKYSYELDGSIFTRSSANVYTHVVVRTYPSGNRYVQAWSGSQHNAEKVARSMNLGYWGKEGCTHDVAAI
jgi:hypothetical protein